MDKQTLAAIALAALCTFGFAGVGGAQAVDPKQPDSASGGVLARAGRRRIAPGAAAPAAAATAHGQPVRMQRPIPEIAGPPTERPASDGANDRPPGAIRQGTKGRRVQPRHANSRERRYAPLAPAPSTSAVARARRRHPPTPLEAAGGGRGKAGG
jgi:hypothetical protein